MFGEVGEIVAQLSQTFRVLGTLKASFLSIIYAYSAGSSSNDGSAFHRFASVEYATWRDECYHL